MSNLSDLKAALIAQAALITDSIDLLDCLNDIDDWYSCRLALTSVGTSGLVSYTIAGRSMTRRPISEVREQESILRARINARLGRGGTVVYADCRDPIDGWSGRV